MALLNDQIYVKKAEEVIVSLQTEDRQGKMELKLTTSKIRNLLSLISAIYNDVLHGGGSTLTKEQEGRIQYLKLRFVYEAGREEEVKKFVKKAEILDHLDEVAEDREKFLLFSRYMEALVAYHKFYGGRD